MAVKVSKCWVRAGAGWAYLFGGSMVPFLFLLFFLSFQLLLHMLDIPSKAVAVEIVVTQRFGKGFLLLQQGCMAGTWSVVTLKLYSTCPWHIPGPN